MYYVNNIIKMQTKHESGRLQIKYKNVNKYNLIKKLTVERFKKKSNVD